MSFCPSELPAFAEKLADIGGEIIGRHFRRSVNVEGKADQSPVTMADRDAEAAIRQHIKQHYPAHGIVGEEYGAEHADAEFVWVLDPIDGTRAFVTGKPLFAQLIALLHKGTPVLGVIDQPFLRERWIGVAGQKTTLNGVVCSVRGCAALDDAVVMYGAQPFPRDAADDLAPHRRLLNAVKTSAVGADGYGYGLLASGHADVMFERDMKLYDFAALVPVVEGAGGVISDWRGKPLDAQSDGTVLACGDRCVWLDAQKYLQAKA